MGKGRKKRKNRNEKLQRKDAYFEMPLQTFSMMFPWVPIPPEVDIFDPAYIVRFRPVHGKILVEIGYNSDNWMII